MKKLTTHVLDTAHGKPGSGIKIELYRVENSEKTLVTTQTTNSDGRTDIPLLDEAQFRQGVWEIVFFIGDYFKDMDAHLVDPLFLDQVPLRFGINSDAHYHVPLLASPWSYSTYRGS